MHSCGAALAATARGAIPHGLTGIPLPISSRSFQSSGLSDGVVVLHWESEIDERTALWIRADILPPSRQPRPGESRDLGRAGSLRRASRIERSGWRKVLSCGK